MWYTLQVDSICDDAIGCGSNIEGEVGGGDIGDIGDVCGRERGIDWSIIRSI